MLLMCATGSARGARPQVEGGRIEGPASPLQIRVVFGMGRNSDDRYKVKVGKCSADVLGRACILARETSDGRGT